MIKVLCVCNRRICRQTISSNNLKKKKVIITDDLRKRFMFYCVEILLSTILFYNHSIIFIFFDQKTHDSITTMVLIENIFHDSVWWWIYNLSDQFLFSIIYAIALLIMHQIQSATNYEQ